MKFAVGITTAPRRPSTLDDCLRSAVRTGFEQPHIFAEPGTVLSPFARSFSVLQRRHPLGAFRNFVQGLRDLLQLHPSAGAYVMLQDDVEFCAGVREFLEHDLWPSPGTGIVSLYASKKYEQKFGPGPVCRRIKTNSHWGALAYVIPRKVVKRMLKHELTDSWARTDRTGGPHRLHAAKRVDFYAGRCIQALGLEMWYYIPSLARHAAVNSTLGNGDNRGRRNSVLFPGTDACAAEVFAAERPGCRYTLPGGTTRYAQQGTAVVVVSHNYGRYLGEALESVVSQETPAQEILVVDDASDDDTRAVAESFTAHGVRYLRTEHRDVYRARRSGMEATTAPVLCFLDADDRLPPDYLAQGVPQFRPGVGLVFSDVQMFGARRDLNEYHAGDLSVANFCHATCLVRRAALELSGAFDGQPAGQSYADWYTWRRVVDAGWDVAKNPAALLYRKHGASMMDGRTKTETYYEHASLCEERLTLAVPLSGRAWMWPEFSGWLGRQTWPREQVSLLLLDSSGDDDFGRRVREWLLDSEYSDSRYLRLPGGAPGLADRDRRVDREALRAVRLAVPRIYNRVRRECSTPYLWIVEDDILPPDNAAELLLRGFDKDTASVSGVYPSRFARDAAVAWKNRTHRLQAGGKGIEQVFGNGFGCVVLRRSALPVFHHDLPTADYDRNFYVELADAGWTAKLHWDCRCEHKSVLKPDVEPTVKWSQR